MYGTCCWLDLDTVIRLYFLFELNFFYVFIFL